MRNAPSRRRYTSIADDELISTFFSRRNSRSTLTLETSNEYKSVTLMMMMMKKQVTFNDGEPHIVPNDEGITEEEEASLFYSRGELAAIVGHCKSVILGQIKDDCTRGLELMNNTDQRNYHKIIVRQILKEQRRQQIVGCVSADELARVAQEISLHRMTLAQARGKQDAKAAKEGVWERIRNGAKRSSLRNSFLGTKVTEERKQERRAQRAIRTGSSTEQGTVRT